MEIKILGGGCANCRALEALATPGHASNHMAFVLPEETALFSGDHVMGWSTTIVAPPDGDMFAYMASLEGVIARGFSTIWPTHDAAVVAAVRLASPAAVPYPSGFMGAKSHRPRLSLPV